MLPFIFFVTGGFSQSTEYQKIVEKYVQTYKEIAIQEMMEYHIPASVTLAQGIHESRAGQSPLAKEANNHFGIKCHKEWFGETYYEDDDRPNECFRKYENPFDSFRDHSFFLTQRDRYRDLFNLTITDYKGWATGLQKAGYATNPKYAESLIKIIETYSLYQFDNPLYAEALKKSDEDFDDPVTQPWLRRFQLYAVGPDNRKVFANNELQMTIARRSDNLSILSHDFYISEKRLMRYNDLTHSSALEPGQIVYLQPKRRKGAVATHQVTDGETLYRISQLYGIKLKMLYKRNGIPHGVEPSPGSILKLR
ncbi:MAG: glucosaminidase domain-containing protein [Bacteroidales bacterium]|nr:glucosaminidase domain-containing protein [Bacteroidales bacterium]